MPSATASSNWPDPADFTPLIAAFSLDPTASVDVGGDACRRPQRHYRK
jgi:hypothetical protein